MSFDTRPSSDQAQGGLGTSWVVDGGSQYWTELNNIEPYNLWHFVPSKYILVNTMWLENEMCGFYVQYLSRPIASPIFKSKRINMNWTHKRCPEETTQNYVGLWNKEVWNICFTPSSFVAKKAPFWHYISMCIWQNINVNYSGNSILLLY